MQTSQPRPAFPRRRPLQGRHRGNSRLLLLDGNATIADADLDAGGLLPFLVELIAENHGDDGERADNEVADVAIHGRRPISGPGSAKTIKST